MEKEVSEAQAKFNVGDKVSFNIERNKFEGTIEKTYINSFLVTFNSNDPTIMDKYHNKTIINNKDLKLIK